MQILKYFFNGETKQLEVTDEYINNLKHKKNFIRNYFNIPFSNKWVFKPNHKGV